MGLELKNNNTPSPFEFQYEHLGQPIIENGEDWIAIFFFSFHFIGGAASCREHALARNSRRRELVLPGGGRREAAGLERRDGDPIHFLPRPTSLRSRSMPQ